jgi:hypothetical protein
VSTELKANSIVDKDNIGEAEAIIKKGVQAALENLKKY